MLRNYMNWAAPFVFPSEPELLITVPYGLAIFLRHVTCLIMFEWLSGNMTDVFGFNYRQIKIPELNCEGIRFKTSLKSHISLSGSRIFFASNFWNALRLLKYDKKLAWKNHAFFATFCKRRAAGEPISRNNNDSFWKREEIKAPNGFSTLSGNGKPDDDSDSVDNLPKFSFKVWSTKTQS